MTNSNGSLRERAESPSDRYLKQCHGKEWKQYKKLPPIGDGERQTYDEIKQLAIRLFRGLDTPLSRDLASKLVAGDVMGVAKSKVSPGNYSDPHTFYADYCSVSFLGKYEDLAKIGRNIKPDYARSETIKEFYRAEDVCRETNEFFDQVANGNVSLMPFERRVLHRAQIAIKSYLGACPKTRDLAIRFGPGSTSQCSGDDGVTVGHKLAAYPECYRDSLSAVSNLRENSPVWFNLTARLHPTSIYNVRGFCDDFGNLILRNASVAPKLVRGNMFSVVPKKALIGRGIATEAHSSSVFQLAIGGVLGDCIARIGLAKETQQVRNNHEARKASINGQRGTIDLKAASDTIAYLFLRLLLIECPGWFNLLDQFRAPETCVEGEWVELHKFSSMGNGYTFELETLVFYALTRAVCDELGYVDEPVDVFGDDIIVPAEAVSSVVRFLSVCGFTTNVDKTFVDSGFNESCGGDFMNGEDVRPYFLKETPKHALDWVGIANGIRRMGCKHDPCGDLDVRFRRAWLYAVSRVPTSHQYYGPARSLCRSGTTDPRYPDRAVIRSDITVQTYGDNWIHTTETSRWNQIVLDCIRYQVGMKPVLGQISHDRFCGSTIYAAALYGSESETSQKPGHWSSRGDPIGLKVAAFTVM